MRSRGISQFYLHTPRSSANGMNHIPAFSFPAEAGPHSSFTNLGEMEGWVGLFFGWGARSEYRLKISVFVSTGSICPKISGRSSRPTNHSSCQKTRMNHLSCCIRMWAQVSFVLSQITRLTNRRTDGQTAFSWLVRAAIPCSAVKSFKKI